MVTYRAGQRVRIEWPDGAAVEGTLDESGRLDMLGSQRDRWSIYASSLLASQGTVTVLDEPRPDEPTGLGAVVEAEHDLGGLSDVQSTHRATVIRVQRVAGPAGRSWRCDACQNWYPWHDLLDPVIRHDGYRAT